MDKLQEALDFFLNASLLAEKIFGKEDERSLIFKKRYQDLKDKKANSRLPIQVLKNKNSFKGLSSKH